MSEPRLQVTAASRKPILSVIVASAASAEQRGRFFEAISRQTFAEEEIEWVIVDSCGTEDTSRMWKTLSLPLGTPLPEMWGAGIAVASGAWIAIMETTCPPLDNWTTNVMAAIRRGENDIFGGAVDLSLGQNATGRAAYFCEYAQFMSPLPCGTATELPGNNVCFRRELLDLAPRFTRGAFWKSYWCGELKSQGIPLLREPTMIVRFEKSYRFWEFMRRRFHHGRCYGGMRFAPGDRRRIIYAAAMPLLLALFCLRVAHVVFPKPRLFVSFATALPVTLLSLIAWVVGEGMGYLRGSGTSCQRID